jgi:hypothetical protein
MNNHQIFRDAQAFTQNPISNLYQAAACVACVVARLIRIPSIVLDNIYGVFNPVRVMAE